jgi:hypothetical protein
VTFHVRMLTRTEPLGLQWSRRHLKQAAVGRRNSSSAAEHDAILPDIDLHSQSKALS